jgi:predicted XRE-type DNA-binding protein
LLASPVLGTKWDNNLDKVKLTWHQIESIHAMRAAGSMSMQQIASLFGVSRSLVSMILANKIWRSQRSALVTA